MAVLRPKQSARLALQLNSPPETWICENQHQRLRYASARARTPPRTAVALATAARTLSSVALRIGRIPESKRWTSAPTAQKSRMPSPAGMIGVPMSVICALWRCGAVSARVSGSPVQSGNDRPRSEPPRRRGAG